MTSSPFHHPILTPGTPQNDALRLQAARRLLRGVAACQPAAAQAAAQAAAAQAAADSRRPVVQLPLFSE